MDLFRFVAGAIEDTRLPIRLLEINYEPRPISSPYPQIKIFTDYSIPEKNSRIIRQRIRGYLNNEMLSVALLSYRKSLFRIETEETSLWKKAVLGEVDALSELLNGTVPESYKNQIRDSFVTPGNSDKPKETKPHRRILEVE